MVFRQVKHKVLGEEHPETLYSAPSTFEEGPSVGIPRCKYLVETRSVGYGSRILTHNTKSVVRRNLEVERSNP